MFYSTDEPCPLPHNPLKAIVSPRPIGWISTQDKNGQVNLAPYSFFNAVCSTPSIVMFSSEGLKDSARNALETGEFVVSLATLALKDAMNASSAPVETHVNEYTLAGLEPASCVHVSPPRVAISPASLECKTLPNHPMTDLNGNTLDVHMVLGQVVGVHIHDDYISDAGLFDTAKAQPLARCGYRDYAAVESVFQLTRPAE